MLMRKIAVQSLWICFFASCTGKEEDTAYFKGTITYAYDYESNTVNVDSLERERPSKSLFIYDSLNYMSRFFGKDTLTYFYSGKINKALEQINSSGN